MNEVSDASATSGGEPQVRPDLEAGQTLFDSMVASWVEPELRRRREAGEWSEKNALYRFQVQFLDNDEVATRLNDEVKGILTVKALGTIEAGQEVFASDFSEIAGYQLPEEHSHHSHVTAFEHNGQWFLTFQFADRDPTRHQVLAVGREFLSAAQDALGAGRLRAFFDLANSAVELLAKAELPVRQRSRSRKRRLRIEHCLLLTTSGRVGSGIATGGSPTLSIALRTFDAEPATSAAS